MKQEYDFSGGERGKFYHAEAELALPVYLDPDVAVFVRRRLSAIASSLSVAQRLIHVLDHLGLPKAHFALRHPVDLVDLLEHAPERVASVVLQGATGRPEPFAPVAAHSWVLGDAGPTAQMHARLAALPSASCTGSRTIPSFLERHRRPPHRGGGEHHAPFPPADGCGGAPPPVSVSGAGEVAGVTYVAAGSGTPVVLLPLGLASRQWEPVLPHLQAHHCTIVLGGPYLKPVEQLEAGPRAAMRGWRSTSWTWRRRTPVRR